MQKKINLKFIFIFLVLLSLLYYLQLFIYNTNSLVLNKYLLLLISIIIISVFTKTPFFIWKKIYFPVYYITSIYLGYLFNSLLLCSIYRLFKIIININSNISSFMIVYFPIIISIYGVINARIIRIEKEVIIKSNKYKNNNGIKICHLTDLHLGTNYQRNFVQKVISLIKNNIKPDIVVITGDLFDSSYTPMVENIEPFDELNIPILYITGNHEIMIGKNDVLNVLNRTKIKNIGNELNPYTFKDINFIGLDFETKVEKLKEIKYDKNMFNVVLNHVPISPKDLSQYDVDLFLCGHTHGGQTFPFNVLTLLNAKCYVGLYEYLNRYVYVSSGLGTALIPMRIGSKSAISVIKIESDKEKTS